MRDLLRLVAALLGARVAGTLPPAIAALTSDSRSVQPGTLFVALSGEHADGHDFAADAVARGAVALVVERELPLDVAQIVVADTRVAASALADAYFDHPSQAMLVAGVTGTNGKTTTTHLLRDVFEAAGIACGVIGTLGASFRERTWPLSNTTPLALELHELLAALRDAGAEAVAMEVSSHALALHRVDHVAFDVAALTNITRDHLDFHGTLEAYAAAKRRLFDLAPRAVLNADDAFGAAWLHELPHATAYGIESGNARDRRQGETSASGGSLSDQTPGTKTLCEQRAVTLSLSKGDHVGLSSSKPGSPEGDMFEEQAALRQAQRNDVRALRQAQGDGDYRQAQDDGELRQAQGDGQLLARDVLLSPDGSTFSVLGRTLRAQLPGRFNVANALAALGVALALDVPIEAAARGIAATRDVPGRMERIAGDGIDAIVDYAHTPDALENVLRAARETARRELIVVFGCGGDRDVGKREPMGEIASRIADRVIVTSDNPRSEDPMSIASTIAAGCARANGHARGKSEIELDRRAAIRRAIAEAQPGDLVVVAGKGHEPYQIVGSERRAFDDRDEVRAAFADRAMRLHAEGPT